MAVIPQVITEDRASGAQVIDGSLRFDSTKKQYLTRTPSSASNQKTFTLSGWFKLSSITSNREFLVSGTSNSERTRLIFSVSDAINFYNRTSNTVHDDDSSTALFRDTSSFYHVVISIDNSNTTGTFYVNGESVHTFTTVDTNSYINSTTIHYIGGQVFNDNNYYDGYISQLYLIDGQALDPSYFGYTDPLTGTWRPKKFKSSINNGTTWSNDLTTANPNSGFRSGFPATWAFDGAYSGGATTDASVAGCQIVWSPTQFPASNGPYTLEVLSTGTAAANGGWDFRLLKVNGTTVFDPGVDTPPSSGFVTVSNLTEITEVIVERDSTSGRAKLDMIRVNGVPLIDGATNDFGVNGFYLPFDGNSPIGEDKSGRGNDWTPVNFGGSMDITKATGALPILNTVNGGRVATAGVRTDANASNLILAVPLNGNTQDYSGQINNSRTPLTFSVNGNAAPTTAQSNFYGGSYTFDGTTDSVYATVPNSDALFLQNSNFTVECWARIASGQTDDRYFITLGSGSSTNAEGSWYLRIFQSKFEFVIVDGGTQYKTVGVNNYVPDKWTHIAFVREGNAQRLYIDGILETTEGYTVFPNLNNSSSLFIGSSYGYNNTINAQIQDVRIYDNVAKYTSNFIPASTNPDILPDTPSGVAYGSALTKITDGAVAFDGSLDFLALNDSSDFSFNGDFTVEAFVYQTVQADHKNIFSTEDFDFKIRGNGKVRIYTASSGTDTTQTVPLNKWIHLALVRESGTIKVYFDGVGETVSQTIASDGSSAAEIGRRIRGSQEPFSGFISNLRVIKGTALYTSNFTPPTEPLTAVTNTKLLCCQSTTSATAAAVQPSPDITVTSSNDGIGSVGSYTAITSSGNYYYDNRPSQGGTGSAWIQIDFASTQSSVTSIKFSGGAYQNQSLFDVYVNGVLVANDKTTNTLWAEDEVTISSTDIDSIRIEGSDGYAIGAVKLNDTLVSGTFNIQSNGDAAATNFNPFTTDINTVRGQETSYATWDPLLKGANTTLSDGNLTNTTSGGTTDGWATSTIVIPRTGKYYVEFTAGTMVTNTFYGMYDTSDWSPWTFNGIDGNQGGFYGYQANTGEKYNTGSASYGDAVTLGDTVGALYNADDGTLSFTLNGVSQGVAFSSIDYSGGFKVWFNANLATATPHKVNFGQKPFKFPPPEGFQPLCSANLPRPTEAAVRPDKYFKTMLWTGNSSTQAITGVGFQPDFVWGKARSVGYAHKLFDSVRGTTRALVTSSTDAEITVSGLTSFDSDGFTLGSNLDTNLTTHTYVGWCWKGGTPENYVPSSGAVLFDGSGDYLNVSDDDDFDFDGDFTIETFINFNDVPTNSFVDFLGSSNNSAYLGSGQSGWIASFYTLTVTGLQFRLSYQNNNAWEFELGWDYNVTPHRWYHVAYTRESGTIYCYVNGVRLTRSATSGTESVTMTSSNGAIRVGSGYATTLKQLNGYLSNLRIIKGTAIYTSNFTSSSEPLTNVTNTKLLCCQSATSASAATVAPGSITVNGDAVATTYNPFDAYRIDGRVYATAAEAGLNGGTITPTGASVNTESGFSIITYTGDGNTSSGVTINHGLGDTPAFIITKKRNSGTTDNGWSCWHKDLGGNYGIWLNSGNTRNPSMWAGHTNISSTVFSPPDLNYGNEDGQAYVNYLWSEVPGFSKFGAYIGNGAVNGPLIDCGFRPAWVMVKVAGGSTGNSWTVWDNKRDTHNEMNLYLHPNETQQDGSYFAIKMDFYSTGFKPRGDIIHQNTDGTMYIYAAFAEAPTFNLYGGQANAR